MMVRKENPTSRDCVILSCNRQCRPFVLLGFTNEPTLTANITLFGLKNIRTLVLMPEGFGQVNEIVICSLAYRYSCQNKAWKNVLPLKYFLEHAYYFKRNPNFLEDGATQLQHRISRKSEMMYLLCTSNAHFNCTLCSEQ